MINKVSSAYKHNILIIALGPFLKIIEAIFDLLIPLIMKAIIDLSQYGSPNNIPNKISASLASLIRSINGGSTNVGDAITGGLIILIMGLVGYIITMISQFLAAKASVSVGTEVRSSIYEKTLRLSKKEREQISNAKLLTLINSDSYQLQHGVLLFVRLVVRAPFILIGSLIISFILDWRVGIAFSAVVLLVAIIYFVILRHSAKGYVEIQSNLDEISNQTSETVEGARVVRASNNQEYESDRFANKTMSYQNKSIKVNRLNALINPLIFAITSIVLIVIILLLQNSLFSPNNTDVASIIIAEMSYLAQIFFVVVQLSMVIVELVKAHVSRKRIDSVLSIEPQIVNVREPKTGELKDNEPVIKFDHVYYLWFNRKNTIDSLSGNMSLH